ncbi:MAG: integrase [Saprospiraceae bacterium]|jgi:integrase
MAIKVTLRQKKISKGRKSLYLDFYPPIPHPETGEPTRREFLGLYIFEKTKTPLDKQHNTETLRIGESIRQKRENFLNKPEIYSQYEKEQLRLKGLGEQCFVEYFLKLANKRKASNHDNWVSAHKYLDTFTNGSLKFANLNEKFLEDFKEYLLTTKSNRSNKATLSQNSAVSYFNKVKATLKQAYKDGYLQTDLNAKIKCIESVETLKQTLTIEELNTLAKTDCRTPLLKKVVLFSALTGMAFKEMQNLNWGQIEVSETFGIRIKMIRQKTKKPYHINISEQAYILLGERKEPTDKVFVNLKDRHRYKLFHSWLVEAGIKKVMTFHDLRHTYGCLQIDLGTDIYTLQGNMGHSTPRQSMKYGKISDQRKREAADKIKLDF